MKKLLVLLVIAGVAGAIIARKEPTSAQPAEDHAGPEPAAARVDDDGGEPGSAPAAEPAVPRPRPENPHPRPERVRSALAQSPAEEQPERRAVSLSVPAPAARAPEPSRQADQLPPGDETSGVSDAISKARRMLREGKLCEARRLLTDLYLKARGDRAVQCRKLLEPISSRLVFDPRCMEGAKVHTVSRGETLVKIAKDYGLNWRMIARLNGISEPGNLSVGQTVKIVTGPPKIVVVKGEFRLTLLMDGQYVREYPIGIGKGDLTPAGSFVVDTMLVRPRWYKPGGGIIEYGEEGHLLGERWIGFRDEPGATGLGIHGTPQRQGIGEKCSNGCIRMTNEEVMELYDFVVPGTKVLIQE